MADFQLHENDAVTSINSRRPRKTGGGITQKLIDWGLAKTESQAKLYMLVFIVIGFAIIVYMNMSTFSTPEVVDPAAEFEV